MKTVIADAGPIIHLTEADCVEALTILGSVIAQQAVADEVSCVLNCDNCHWRSVVSVVVLDERQKRFAQMISSSAGLHRGEAEALALAESAIMPTLLTDDAAARVFATQQGIEVRGSLGLVLATVALKRFGVEEGLAALARLRSSSLWVSQSIYEKALTALESMR